MTRCSTAGAPAQTGDGTFLLEGVLIKGPAFADLRQALACVPQETVLQRNDRREATNREEREGRILYAGTHTELTAATRGECWTLVQRQRLVEAFKEAGELASGAGTGTIAGAHA